MSSAKPPQQQQQQPQQQQPLQHSHQQLHEHHLQRPRFMKIAGQAQIGAYIALNTGCIKILTRQHGSAWKLNIMLRMYAREWFIGNSWSGTHRSLCVYHVLTAHPDDICQSGANVLHYDAELTRLSYGAGMQSQRMGMQPQQQQGPPFLQNQQGAAQYQQQPRPHMQHPGPHLISGQGPRPAQQQLQAGHTYIMRPSQAQVHTRHFPLANDHRLALHRS